MRNKTTLLLVLSLVGTASIDHEARASNPDIASAPYILTIGLPNSFRLYGLLGYLHSEDATATDEGSKLGLGISQQLALSKHRENNCFAAEGDPSRSWGLTSIGMRIQTQKIHRVGPTLDESGYTDPSLSASLTGCTSNHNYWTFEAGSLLGAGDNDVSRYKHDNYAMLGYFVPLDYGQVNASLRLDRLAVNGKDAITGKTTVVETTNSTRIGVGYSRDYNSIRWAIEPGALIYGAEPITLSLSASVQRRLYGTYWTLSGGHTITGSNKGTSVNLGIRIPLL